MAIGGVKYSFFRAKLPDSESEDILATEQCPVAGLTPIWTYDTATEATQGGEVINYREGQTELFVAQSAISLNPPIETANYLTVENTTAIGLKRVNYYNIIRVSAFVSTFQYPTWKFEIEEDIGMGALYPTGGDIVRPLARGGVVTMSTDGAHASTREYIEPPRDSCAVNPQVYPVFDSDFSDGDGVGVLVQVKLGEAGNYAVQLYFRSFVETGETEGTTADTSARDSYKRASSFLNLIRDVTTMKQTLSTFDPIYRVVEFLKAWILPNYLLRASGSGVATSFGRDEGDDFDPIALYGEGWESVDERGYEKGAFLFNPTNAFPNQIGHTYTVGVWGARFPINPDSLVSTSFGAYVRLQSTFAEAKPVIMLYVGDEIREDITDLFEASPVTNTARLNAENEAQAHAQAQTANAVSTGLAVAGSVAAIVATGGAAAIGLAGAITSGAVNIANTANERARQKRKTPQTIGGGRGGACAVRCLDLGVPMLYIEEFTATNKTECEECVYIYGYKVFTPVRGAWSPFDPIPAYQDARPYKFIAVEDIDFPELPKYQRDYFRRKLANGARIWKDYDEYSGTT